MKWNHLPNAGGLYNQNPDLLEKFQTIFRMMAEFEERDRHKREREQARKSPRRRGYSPSRSHT